MYIIGDIEDQITTLVWGQISKFPFQFSIPHFELITTYKSYFFNYLYPWMSSQPILWGVVSSMMSLFGIGAYNILLISTTLLNYLGSYLLFKKYRYGVFFSLMFAFSPFAAVHMGRHIDLIQIWLLPVFVFLVNSWEDKDFSAEAALKIGLFLSFAILISNYLGFFLLILFTLYLAFTSIDLLVESRRKILTVLKGYLITLGIVIALVGSILSPFIYANYFTKSEVSVRRVVRSIDDFVTFSSRPWYYLIPAVKNPFFGESATKVLKVIEDTGNFLADDYFAGEHQANYLGYVLYLSALGFSLFAFMKGDCAIKRKLWLWWGIAVVVFIFSLPPYIMISGHRIILPSYILFKSFPMFRVLSRLSVLLHLSLLIIFALGSDFVYHSIAPQKKKIFSIVMLTLVLASFTETYIPLEFHKVEKAPEVYSYLSKLQPKNQTIVVYPYSRLNEAILRLSVHKKNLINPRYYETPHFNAEIFTKNLNSEEGIGQLRVFDVAHFVVFRDSSEEDLQFFQNNPNLTLEAQFPESLLFNVVK